MQQFFGKSRICACILLLRLIELKMKMTHAIKEIVLYDDHVDIIYNSPTQAWLTTVRAFCFTKNTTI